MKYGDNIGRWIEDHPGLYVEAGPGGFGYSIRRRGPRGRPVGERLTARTLDQLDKLAAALLPVAQ